MKKKQNRKIREIAIYRMLEIRYIWGIILVLGLLLMNGCKIQKTVDEIPKDKIETEKTDTDAEPLTESIPESSIAAKDWNIKKYSVEGTDNLYELPLEELCDENAYISCVKSFGNQVLVMFDMQQEGRMAQTKLYLIDPLTTEINAKITLPDGAYYSDGVYIKDKHIKILNTNTMEMIVYDDNLRENAVFSLGDVKTNNVVISNDSKYVYYMDNSDGEIYQFQIENGQSVKLFESRNCNSDNFGRVIGLLNQDSCLAFSYYNTESEETIYEVREISTGGIIYQDSAELSGIECEGEKYLLRHYEEGLSEILFGNIEETNPKVLTLKDYKEYDFVMTDFSSSSVISCKMTENAKEAYQLAVGKKQQAELAENEKVTMLSLNQYSIQTGKRQYGIDIYNVLGEQDFLWGCQAAYVKETDCIICCIDGAKKRWLVWDLTKESSKTGDESNYVYKWQNPKEPDDTALAELRNQAEDLGNKNGVDIHIGKEVEKCPKDIYEYKVSNNVIRIEKMLKVLEKALGKYPKGMLAQLGTNEYEGSRLQIYLAGEITPTDETGINSIGIQNTIENETFLVLDINSFGNLENTIYHEIFHAIENHLNWDEIAYFDYDVWDSLNPEGFEYDFDYKANEENYDYDYTVDDTEHECYFIDTYSKSFPNEDRARIMEYAMFDDGEDRRSNIKAAGIQAKLKYISEQIRKGFDTTGWPETTSWEEVLK